MRQVTLAAALLLVSVQIVDAQVGGNVGYNQGPGRARAEQNERAKRQLSRDEMPPSETSIYLDASILLNAKADEFVAVFALSESADSVEGCQEKMKATVDRFTEALKPLGINADAIFVDFTAQTKTYAYKVEGNLAKEHLEGFELKKTVSIRYRDKTLIDRVIVAASKAKIYDLIKVDYVVTDPAPMQEKLADAASAVIKAKAARHGRLLGLKLKAVPQVYAERYSTYFPTEMYDSYVAAEGEAIATGFDHNRTTVQSLRKTRTFYYNPLNGSQFDRVIEPVVIEPVVQFTLYLKLRYEIDKP